MILRSFPYAILLGMNCGVWRIHSLLKCILDIVRHHCHLSICWYFLWVWQIPRRLWRPPESGCGIFDGPQLSENWLQLTFFDGLALPYALKLVCSQKESLKFITKCLKTPSKLKGDSPTASNLGNQSYGFVSKWNQISFPLKLASGPLIEIASNSGKLLHGFVWKWNHISFA